MGGKHVVAVLAAVSLASGCATVFGGAGEVQVTVAPPAGQASIQLHGVSRADERTVDGAQTRFRLSRDTDYVLTAHRPGRPDAQVMLNRQINPWFWANGLVLVPTLIQSLASAGVAKGASSWTMIDLAVIGLIAAPVLAGIDLFSGNVWTHGSTEVTVPAP